MFFPVKMRAALLLCLFAQLGSAQTNPAITSWVLNTTGLTGYNCSGCSPAVAGNIPADVQSVYYDATYAYVSTKGIPSYDIGPWQNNPNTPSDQNKIYRIKLSPSSNGVHTATPLGNIGIWANGIGVFNAKDGMSYNNQGVWNRNAYYYEGISFDNCLGHAAPNGNYHNHVNPSCLYDASGASGHSPILGYAFDGYPIYGAFAYANTNGTGGIRRMVSGYTLSPNTTRAGGPPVSGQYPAGCFCEDYVYTGAGDLDQYNGRNCVTPEYPSGTYAYFVTLDANGDPQYPFVVGPTFYGSYSMANTVTSIPAGATQYSPALPVELIEFSGKNEGKTNVLSWVTASESSNEGFELEYSVDGANFDFLALVRSKSIQGNSLIRLNYRFVDESPEASLVYYRLKQKDRDQQERYSPTISIKNRSFLPEIQIFPNPVVNNVVQLRMGDNKKDLSVSILNAQGRVLVDRNYKALAYDPLLSVHAPYLNPGVYWLRISVEGTQTVKTIVFDEE